MDSEHTPPPPKIQDLDNPPTRLPSFGAAPGITASALDDAYARARRRMDGVPAAAAGYRLFWVRGSHVGWMDLPAGGAYAVIGRHTNCDVVLEHEPEISLRHMLAATIELADGLALRLLDLRTSIPFYLSDDAPRSSIVASGAIAVRLGGYVIGAVPVEAGAARPVQQALPPALPKARITDGRSLPMSVRPGPSGKAGNEPSPAAPMDGFDIEDPVSHVTSLPPPAPIFDLPRRPPPAPRGDSAPGRGPAPPSGDAAAVLMLRREGLRASIELTEGELDVGVLVGRSDRCHDGGLQAVLDSNISRGHLVLLRQHDGFEAFDLCSTQGTFQGGRQGRRFTLEDRGPALTLAAVNPVTLEWKLVR